MIHHDPDPTPPQGTPRPIPTLTKLTALDRQLVTMRAQRIELLADIDADTSIIDRHHAHRTATQARLNNLCLDINTIEQLMIDMTEA